MCFIMAQCHQDKLGLAGSKVLIHFVHVALVPISTVHIIQVFNWYRQNYGNHTCMFEFDCPCSMLLLSVSPYWLNIVRYSVHGYFCACRQ